MSTGGITIEGNMDFSYVFKKTPRKRLKGQPRWATKKKRIKGQLMAMNAAIYAEIKRQEKKVDSDQPAVSEQGAPPSRIIVPNKDGIINTPFIGGVPFFGEVK